MRHRCVSAFNRFSTLENNLDRLQDLYREDPRIATLNQFLAQEGQPSRVLLSGLIGAQTAFVLTASYQNEPRNHLFIANDKEEAAYLQNNLSNLMHGKAIGFFPDSFKRPMHFEELNNTNVLQRTETINKLVNARAGGEIVVTYPEALFEQVVSPQVLNERRIAIVKGEELDVDFLIEVLVEYGFAREDFVYEPGQFSIRGGIIDIFSFGNEYPYRIELFDEEVESIRTFNPTTQLSVSNIGTVTIIPNINTRFSQEQKVSMLRILQPGSVVWARDLQVVIDKLTQCFEKAEEFAKGIALLEEEELKEIFRDRAFIRPNEIIEDIAAFPIIGLSELAQPISFDERVVFAARPQPSFNKNFNLLISNLNENTEAGLENYLFAENPKQIERFYAIFEDLEAHVRFHPIPKSVDQGFIDLDLKVACYTDHQVFQRFHRYKLRRGFTRDQALNLRMLRELQPGDYVTHIDHGVGKYSGLQKIDINGHVQESVRLIYKNNDILYVSINSLHKISKFVGKDGTAPKVDKLGSDAWKNLKRRTKKKVKDIAGELIKLYAKRKAAPGVAFPADGYLQNELEASFIYEDTPDQLKATNEMKEDMMKSYPMDRLICGDVGFGKTEVAIRGAFKAVVGGKQVAVLVPTTILALQHYRTFKERLADFGVSVDYINRFRSTKEKNEIFQRLKSGELDMVIGTHAILNKKIGFKDLGLLIIDEEQKFGVAAKEKLRNIKVNVDTLTLTATPIPRTLQFSLMAARDLSIIRTPPPNRQPIHTEVRIFNEEVVKEAIYYEVNRGGQVFFVHNRVKTLPDVTAMIRRMCPDVEIGSAHGQMDPKELEKTLIHFIDGRFDVLVCTNIIETGLDIPNANTMMINNANQFGMSDLHQLRGRVGRSNQKAFCYLFSPPMSTLTSEARKRLKTLEEFSDLGSGFDIAMRDLDIRGAGNLLGGEQSGFISDIGYETYQKILEEAIQELKENEFKDLFKEELDQKREYVREVQIDTDAEMLIPDEYVSSIQERLNLYTELDSIADEAALQAFEQSLRDRFGRIPAPVFELFNGLRLRWVCKRLGFERVILKNGKLRCYFVENPQSMFYESEQFQRTLKFVQQEGARRGLSFKKSTRHFMLIKDGVRGLQEALRVLGKIDEKVAQQTAPAGAQ
ncbi:transcription-repair coupling factor [Phaeodactylibacter luteus]|uniref:Transcription-repair-coupling factor n=1 Tax=Phaeodactylibacter luteus TaxID=1564516 RepID=A0A5C6RKF3_9BACT|nr:transcription-repair coupling factor [Phaeodactylibacter luteus]